MIPEVPNGMKEMIVVVVMMMAGLPIQCVSVRIRSRKGGIEIFKRRSRDVFKLKGAGLRTH